MTVKFVIHCVLAVIATLGWIRCSRRAHYALRALHGGSAPAGMFGFGVDKAYVSKFGSYYTMCALALTALAVWAWIVVATEIIDIWGSP